MREELGPVSIVGAQLHALAELGQGEAPAWPGDTLGPGPVRLGPGAAWAPAGPIMPGPSRSSGPAPWPSSATPCTPRGRGGPARLRPDHVGPSVYRDT